MIVQVWWASSSIVALPIPALPPVITITLPVKSRSTSQTGPLKYLLAKTNSETVAAAAPKT